MGTPASSWSIKAGRKAAKVGAGAQPCLIRSQVKLCGSWPVTPCTIVHNAISISSTSKINQTLNSFKCFCGKTLPFSFQRQIYLKGRPFFYLETFKTFISYRCCVFSQCTERPNLCHLVIQRRENGEAGWKTSHVLNVPCQF